MSGTYKTARLFALTLLLIMAINPNAIAQIKTAQIASRGFESVDSSVTVDSFDSVSQWSTNPAQGVEIAVHSDSGRHGRGMRVDFDFHGHQGYGIVHRNVALDVPWNYEFSFSVRGEAPTNTLEFKLVDDTGASVWWSNNPNFAFPREWLTVARAKRQICFAWGPRGQNPRNGGGDIRHIGAIEFAITAGSGGKGSVWMDDLTLTRLDPDSPFDLTTPVASIPIVGTWESAQVNPDMTGAKLDFAADGSFKSTIGVMLDFNYNISHNRLATMFRDAISGQTMDFTNSIRVEHDTLSQKGDNAFGRDIAMKRVGSAKEGEDPIIGSWSFPDYTGALAFVAFAKNGRGLFREPWSSCSGTWTDSGSGHLTVTLNRFTVERDYSIENGVLTLKYVEGKDGGNVKHVSREVKYIRRAPVP
jgi:hypothetical protein